MARSPAPILIQAPDFGRIREESGSWTEEAIRSLYLFSEDTRRRILNIERMFDWLDVPHASGDFTANSGTWTVADADQKLYRYTKVGRIVSLNFFLEDTTTGSGMGTQLRIKMPFGMQAAATTYMGPLIVRGSVNTEGYVTTEGTDTLYCYRTDHAAWPSSVTNNLDIRGTLTCQVID
jgi:hypothetical protein